MTPEIVDWMPTNDNKIVDWMPHWISVTIMKKATETYQLLITTKTIWCSGW